ncbi:MAG: DUF922 domain-containing protein [Burkholderiales bacterium]
MLKVSLVLATSLAVLAAPSAAEPLVRMSTSYYYIEGGSALILTEQIRKKGPVGIDGKRHASRTRWNVQWKFRHNVRDDKCQMDDATVAVGINATRPRWRGEKTGPASLKRRWKQMIEAIERGEEHHKQQATLAGNQILAALEAMPPARNCQVLIETANRTANGILEKYQAASEAYDRRTEHGRKDGASLI